MVMSNCMLWKHAAVMVGFGPVFINKKPSFPSETRTQPGKRVGLRGARKG